MGLTTGNLPPIEPAKLYDLPYLERVKLLPATGWSTASARRRSSRSSTS